MASIQVRIDGDGLQYVGSVPREKIGEVITFLMVQAQLNAALTDVEFVRTPGKPSGGKGRSRAGRKCGQCGGEGHTKTTCGRAAGSGIERNEEARPVAKSEAIGPDRYKMIRMDMHDREFMSSKYALTNKLSPREVNFAIKSVSYDHYLDIRQQS